MRDITQLAKEILVIESQNLTEMKRCQQEKEDIQQFLESIANQEVVIQDNSLLPASDWVSGTQKKERRSRLTRKVSCAPDEQATYFATMQE